jgi:hypothetical protein
MQSFGAFTKNAQAIAAEMANYSKKSFEDGSKALERLLGARSLEKTIEIQSDYAKTAYESFIAQATKISELYGDLAKEPISRSSRLYPGQRRRSNSDITVQG